MNLLLIDISDGAFTGLAYKSTLFGHKVKVFNGPGHTSLVSKLSTTGLRLLSGPILF
jgi:hypothetical protein